MIWNEKRSYNRLAGMKSDEIVYSASISIVELSNALVSDIIVDIDSMGWKAISEGSTETENSSG